MKTSYNTSVVRDGLVFHLDPGNISKHGSSPYANLADGVSGTIINQDFEVVNGVFRSNDTPTNVGTSQFQFDNVVLDTGSVTVQWFMKPNYLPDYDDNNNWRRLIASSINNRDPFGFVLEQQLQINFTLQTTTGNKRHLDGNFTPSSATLGVWDMHTYTYDSAAGIASCYKNSFLLLSGPQTASSIEPTQPGEKMATLSASDVMEISHDKGNYSGDACVPADFGPWLIYNRALSAKEVTRNFEAIRGRYGL